MYSQVVVTPPAAEPVTLAEQKLWMRLDDDALENALILDLIRTARAAAELYTGRAFITQTIRLTPGAVGNRRSEWVPGHYDLPVDYFDGGLCRSIALPTPPVRSIVSVTTYDSLHVGTLFANTNYRLLGSQMTLNPGYYWPSNLRPGSPAEIIYTAGYGDNPQDVPSPIRTAIKMHAALMYESRCACDMPPQCEQLLRPYRVVRA